MFRRSARALPARWILLLVLGALLFLRQPDVLSALRLNLRGSELMHQQARSWLAAESSLSHQGAAAGLPGCDRSDASEPDNKVAGRAGVRLRRFNLLARFLCGASYESLRDDALALQAEAPYDGTAAWLLAQSAFIGGYFAEARQILRAASLGESILAFGFAKEAYAQHDPGRAVEILDQFDAWKDEPVIAARAQLYDLACAAYRDAGRLADSLVGCLKLAAAAPESSASWAQLANAYLHLGRTTEAIAASQKALEFEPYNAGLHLALGVCYQNAGMPAEADASYEAAIRLEPDNAPAQLLLATSFLNQKRCQQAQAILDTLVAPTEDIRDQVAALQAEIKARCTAQPSGN